jgi:DNA-binding beta-propeller fold protein YncE
LKRSLSTGIPSLCIAFLLALSAAPATLAQPTPRRALLALSKTNHTLAIVDPTTLKILATAPVGPAPHEVVASADGKTAYVSIFGDKVYHTISVIDLVGQKALPDIDTGALISTHGLAFVGGKLWFTAQGAKAIARYNPADGKIDWIMGTGQDRTHMIYVSSDQKQIYTMNSGSATVSDFREVTLPPPAGVPGAQPRLDWEQTLIPVGKGDEGFDVSPDSRELWTANAQDGTVSIIDLASRKVTTLDAGIVGANRLKFTPDGKLVFISNLRGPDLVIYDAATRKVVKRIAIGHGAAGILMDPVANRAFVACSPDNYIVIVDLKSLTVTGKLDVGGEPDGMAWAERP